MNERDLEDLKTLPLPSIADVAPSEGLPWTSGQQAGLIKPDYLAQFLPPRKDKLGRPRCVQCESILAGRLIDFGTFEWSLAWGEFHCSECGYPGRYYHKLTADDGSEVVGTFMWQVHPDQLLDRKEDEQCATAS